MWPSICHAGLRLRLLELGDVDVAEIGDVAQVEADRLPGEPVERYLVDRRAVLPDV